MNASSTVPAPGAAPDVVRTRLELMEATRPWRRRGLEIALVPTMGALHEGHLALVRRARELADRVVVSIFVNPTQFGETADLAAYPRDTEGDLAKLGGDCDLVFLPEVETIYPPGHSTFVELGPPALGLEGEHRPGHFRGVATVVTQLFNLVRPDLAVFGEKDAQQLAVVRRLVRDLHLSVTIHGVATVREDDGLALSSRNVHLDADARRQATVLYRALSAGSDRITAGERSADAVRDAMRAVFADEPVAELEYVEVVDPATFEPLAKITGDVVLPAAARVGGTRLIDNLPVTLEA